MDWKGQVYIISGTHSSATAQIVRKVETNGDLVFPGQLKGTASAASLVTVANTGNAELEIHQRGDHRHEQGRIFRRSDHDQLPANNR